MSSRTARRLMGAFPVPHRHQSGQSRIMIAGKSVYLGKEGTPEAEITYRRLKGLYQRRGNLDPAVRATVAQLAERFLQDVDRRHRKNGRFTSRRDLKHFVVAQVVAAFGVLPADEFTAADLLDLRDGWVAQEAVRTTVNDFVAIVRELWQYGAENLLVPVDTWLGLVAVRPLTKHDAIAIESEPVRPVPDALIEQTLPLVNPVAATLIRFQRLTGARPCEATSIRACDLDRSQAVWRYRVTEEVNKTAHMDRDRVVMVGPQAQAVLTPWLEACTDATQPLLRIKSWKYGLVQYQTEPYRRHISIQCEKHGIPPWPPSRLRHSWATQVRRQFGVEAASTGLGHANIDTTELYAEKDLALAAEVAAKIG